MNEPYTIWMNLTKHCWVKGFIQYDFVFMKYRTRHPSTYSGPRGGCGEPDPGGGYVSICSVIIHCPLFYVLCIWAVFQTEKATEQVRIAKTQKHNNPQRYRRTQRDEFLSSVTHPLPPPPPKGSHCPQGGSPAEPPPTGTPAVHRHQSSFLEGFRRTDTDDL